MVEVKIVQSFCYLHGPFHSVALRNAALVELSAQVRTCKHEIIEITFDVLDEKVLGACIFEGIDVIDEVGVPESRVNADFVAEVLVMSSEVSVAWLDGKRLESI